MTTRSEKRQRKQRPYPTKKRREDKQQQQASAEFDSTLASIALNTAKEVGGGLHACYARVDELAERLFMHSCLTADEELAKSAFMSCAPPDWMEMSDTTLDTLGESAFLPTLGALTGKKVKFGSSPSDGEQDIPPRLRRLIDAYR